MKAFTTAVLFWALPLLAAPGEYIVLFKRSQGTLSSMDHQALQQHLQTTNQKSVDQLEQWLGSRGARAAVRNLWLIQGAVVALEPQAAQKLAREPWVQSLHPNRFRKFLHPPSAASEITDGPSDLWGLRRINLDKVRAEYPEITGQGVRVAILDTGIQSRHPELRGVPVKFRDTVAHLPNAYDDNGHGTHVAGTIAGKQTGVAPGVSITAVKIFSAAGAGYDADILTGMQWIFDPDGNAATDDYPHIVSNSWGADMTGSDIADLADVAPYHEAILAWIRGGMIPVFAAGNSGATPNGFPGGFPEVIAVGALDVTGDTAEFSSRGPNVWRSGELVLTLMKPDVSAPGVAISSAYPGNKYASLAGTSMATPHVAGALALALQANPKLKLAGAKELLLRSVEKKGDNAFGYGILDAYQLVKRALAP